MSANQSRFDKSDNTVYRKTGRSGIFNQQRPSSGSYSKPGGFAGSASSPSVTSNCSYKKSNNHNNSAQGGQYRATVENVHPTDSTNASGSRGEQNGVHLQPPLRGGADAPVTNTAPKTDEMPANRRSSQTVPKAPNSQPASMNSDTTISKTPVKVAGDPSKLLAFQFGSISPGIVNQMQVPARTTSGPPNLHEQKREQALNDSHRNAPPLPTPPVPKRQLQRMDAVTVDQPKTEEAHPVSVAEKDTHVSQTSPKNQNQKLSVLSISGIPTPVPFHQPHVSVPFGGSQYMQSRGMTASPLHVPGAPLPLQMATNSQLQPQIFVPGLQPHPMQPSATVHQDQNLGFIPPVGSQMPAQLGNLGNNIASQYPQQPEGVKINAQRKPAVRITDPKTNEELRFDYKRPDTHRDSGSSVPRPHPNVAPQSQLMPPFALSHQANYFASPYNSNSIFFPPPPPMSFPLTSGQMASNSQGQRFYHPVCQGAQNISFMNSVVLNPLPASKTGNPVQGVTGSAKAEHAREVHNVISAAPLAKTYVTIRPPADVVGERVTDSSAHKPGISRSHSVIDDQKKPGNKDELLEHESLVTEEQGGKGSSEESEVLNSSAITTEVCSSKFLYLSEKSKKKSSMNSTTESNEVPTTETAQSTMDDRMSHAKFNKMGYNLGVSSSPSPDSMDVGDSHGEVISVDASASRDQNVGSNEHVFTKSGSINQASELSEGMHEGESEESFGGNDGKSLSVTGSKDTSLMDGSKAKTTVSKGKKKRRENLQKADAAGTASDLYMAYKGSEEKKETVLSPQSRERTSSVVDSKQVSSEAHKECIVVSKKDDQIKTELDDWEDAANISTPKLENSDCGSRSSVGDTDGNMAKMYSRDFLLKFAKHFTELPYSFEITLDIEALMNTNTSHLVDCDSHPSSGRMDRRSGGSRIDRLGSGMVDDGRWSKQPGGFSLGRDPHADIAFGGNIGPRAGQGPNYCAAFQYAGGMLYGPILSMGSHGGPDAERWQRATNFQQRGLFPSVNTPLQSMHKAERKYEVGKVTDEEEAKQRQLKGILNKLTPQNFDKLFEQVKEVGIDNAKTLAGVISQIFDKALMEPTFCEMYANFCYHLAGELPDFSDNNEKITFKRLLLNKCQEEFERGEREQEEANKVDEESQTKQTEGEREEKRIKARRRMLGNIRLIGELFKKKMLTERIMHECIKKLLGQYQNPDEEDIEALCKLMSTIGEMIEHPKAKVFMDAYFEMMAKLSNNMRLSSRVRFMLKDSVELRKNKWQQRRKVEGPKKIEEVHRDAAQERQEQSSRFGRGPGMNSSSRRGGPPMEFVPRGSSMLSSPNSQMGCGFRGNSSYVRGYGGQDALHEERQSYGARTLSVPLSQKSTGDDYITLGPQVGLGKGMSIRGPLSVSASSTSPNNTSSGPNDSRRMVGGLNGYRSVSERASYSSRGDSLPRNTPDRFVGSASIDQPSAQEPDGVYGHNREVINSDHRSDRPLSTSPSTRGQGPALTINVSSGKPLSEDRLQDMSMAAIKEFYSARDVKEVAMCIKDLNSPMFHSSMIHLWVTDSFERKDVERNLLAKLLIDLTKSNDGTLTEAQLIKGFESILSVFEDTVNDAPRAPEFLGGLLAKLVLENLVSLREIGQLIYKGGEEPRGLHQVGLAADVLGNILEVIRTEKGDSVLHELCTGSTLRFETFRPPDPIKSRILEKFL